MLKAYVAAQTRLQDLSDRVQQHLRDLRDDESGAALVEYALIVGMMAVVVVGAMTALKPKLDGAFTSIGTRLSTNVN